MPDNAHLLESVRCLFIGFDEAVKEQSAEWLRAGYTIDEIETGLLTLLIECNSAVLLMFAVLRLDPKMYISRFASQLGKLTKEMALADLPDYQIHVAEVEREQQGLSS